MTKDQKIQYDRWRNPEFLAMKYITNSGITNLEPVEPNGNSVLMDIRKNSDRA